MGMEDFQLDKHLQFVFTSFDEVMEKILSSVICRVFVNVGYSSKLRIWQVPAFKMEPQCGIIVMRPPTQLTYHLLDHKRTLKVTFFISLQGVKNKTKIGFLYSFMDFSRFEHC